MAQFNIDIEAYCSIKQLDYNSSDENADICKQTEFTSVDIYIDSQDFFTATKLGNGDCNKSAPSGWYTTPNNRNKFRYWDNAQQSFTSLKEC